MRKTLIAARKSKEISLHGEVELNKTEKTVVKIISWISFFACLITGYFTFEGNLPIYWLIISLSVPFLIIIYFFIKYFIINKEPIHHEKYDLDAKINNITGKEDIKVSNYEHKIINKDKDKGEK